MIDVKFRGKLRAEETSFFTNVELLNRRASKNVILPKSSSDQSKTLLRKVEQLNMSHGSLTIHSSTTSYFELLGWPVPPAVRSSS